MTNKFCCQCGTTENLFELKNGTYGCEDCLNKVGKEQQMFRKKIEEVFGKENLEDTINKLDIIFNSIKDTSIITLNHLIASIGAIKYVIQLENGTLDEEKMQDMLKILEKWQRNVDKN